MDNSIYEVNRNEYVGFISELKPDYFDVITHETEKNTFIKIMSKKTGKHLSTRIVSPHEPDHYFIFNIPDNDERQAGKPVRKIVLETKEEVQSFFDALSKIMKENKHD